MAQRIAQEAISFYDRSRVDYPSTARPLIRVKLAPVGKAPDSVTAYEIVSGWKVERMASPNLTKAIILYQSLREGDPTVLLDEFPWLTNLFVAAPAVSVAQPEARRQTKVGRFALPEIIESEDEETLQANSCDQVADFLGDFDL